MYNQVNKYIITYHKGGNYLGLMEKAQRIII